MNSLETLLKEHYDRYPDMEVRDAVKFLYQSYMGPGHLILDEGAALARLESEWTLVEADSSGPLSEPLGNGLCRLNLSVCKAIGLSTKTVAQLFCSTAQNVSQDRPGLEKALALVESLPFSREQVTDYLAQYHAQDCPMVSHSPTYRNAYSPAYRVVHQRYANAVPLLAAIDRGLADGIPMRVAIDGPCASGKSTLGQLLVQLYHCPLVPMDDFFLLPHNRTPERLAQPGGNVDYERFDREVLSPLCRGEVACYRPWQCHFENFGPERTLEPGPLIVFEGVYSLRSDLRDRYTLRVWLEADWDTRLRRIAARGPGCLARFQELWIPLEDHYFSTCRVKECCNLVLSGNET